MTKKIEGVAGVQAGKGVGSRGIAGRLLLGGDGRGRRESRFRRRRSLGGSLGARRGGEFDLQALEIQQPPRHAAKLGQVILLDPELVDAVVGPQGEDVAFQPVDFQGPKPALHRIGRNDMMQLDADATPQIVERHACGQLIHNLFGMGRP